MEITKLIKGLCDGDNHYFRDTVSVKRVSDWYWYDQEQKKKAFFENYKLQCERSKQR